MLYGRALKAILGMTETPRRGQKSSAPTPMGRPIADLDEPLSDEPDSRNSDETLLCESISALDNEIDKLVEEEMPTPRLLRAPSQQSIIRASQQGQLGMSAEEQYDDSIMKYRDNYPRLWKGYRRILRDHERLIDKLANNTTRNAEGTFKSITYYLDDFALKVSSKKKWLEKKMLAEAIGNDIDTFVARKWKRRYLNILEAVDLLFGDCEIMLNHLNTQPENTESRLSTAEIQKRLNDISSDGDVQFQIENDTSVTLSTVFVSDLLSQLQIYRYELMDVYKRRERLIQILAQSKRQKKELKNIVYRLRTELQYASKKMKESQETMADKLSTLNTSSDVDKRVAEATAELQTQRKSEIIRYEERICELEKMLREEESKRKKLHNKLQELAGNIRVFCRVRPSVKPCVKVESTDKIIISSSDLPEKMIKAWTSPMKCFIFDKVFDPNANQLNVFEAVQALIVSCVDGYNVCIMAYGQTGSGKTYTMMGSEENPGVNRRAIAELLNVCKNRKQWEFNLRISVIEIYQEEARDLLSSTTAGQVTAGIKIMSTQDDDVIISGLSEFNVVSEEDILKLLGRAENNRSVASHNLNKNSSRSHLIVILKIEGENKIHKTTSRGTLTLCDLAGSENILKSGATSGERFLEATSINKSLTALGRVFDSLRRRQKPVYRETKLTYLLKPTLGGDSKCLLFVNVRTEPTNVDESVRALQFGQNAMQVIPEQSQNKLLSRRSSSASQN